MKCPRCQGARQVKTLWATQAGPHGDVPLYAMSRCHVCWGKGWVTVRQADQYAADQAKREAKP